MTEKEKKKKTDFLKEEMDKKIKNNSRTKIRETAKKNPKTRKN